MRWPCSPSCWSGPTSAAEIVIGAIVTALTLAAGLSLWQRRAHALVAVFGAVVAGALLWLGVGEMLAGAEAARALGALGGDLAGAGLGFMTNGAQTIVSAIVPLGLIWFTRPLR